MRHELQIAGRAYRLRPVAESDARYIVDLRSRGGTFLNTGAVTVAQQLHWLDRYFERNGDYFFVIETVDGRTREGLVSLYDVRPLERSAEWGRWVLEPRSSAAVESALLVYRCAFEQLSLAQVRCRTLADNAKVVAFHESCGLTRVPSTVMIDHNGQSRPGVEHVLGSGEWPRVKERLDRLASRFADTAMRSAAQKTELMRADNMLAFHHVGVACTDIVAEAKQFATLGYAVEGEPFEDTVQGVRGQFMAGQSPLVELLEPLRVEPPGVLAPWLVQGVKLYHLGYRVADLAHAIETLRARRGKLVVPPVPAVAFGGRSIAFLMLPNRLLIELIESE